MGEGVWYVRVCGELGWVVHEGVWWVRVCGGRGYVVGESVCQVRVVVAEEGRNRKLLTKGQVLILVC